METCGTEEPYEGKPHVRICGGAGWATTGSTRTGDGVQRPLRFSFQPRLTRSVLAPRKAWRLLQGESPCRERSSHPPVARLASMTEP
jgi:hypothetical protein